MRKRELLCKSFVQSACLAAIVVPPKAALQLLTREATRGKHFFQEARLTPMACYAPSVESRWGLLLSQEWNKAHLINHLAEVHGYRHYLELCTYSSGRRYDEIDRAKFLTCSRLMYRCPDGFDDGLAIDYRSATLDIGECLTTISQEGHSFDIVLVDSWHEFEPSWRDLVEGFRLIRANGTLVVHDCLPPRPEIAVPKHIPGRMVRRQLSSLCRLYQPAARSRGLHSRHRLWLRRHPQARRAISRKRDFCRRRSPRRLAQQARRPHASLRFPSGAQAGPAELDFDQRIF